MSTTKPGDEPTAKASSTPSTNACTRFRGQLRNNLANAFASWGRFVATGKNPYIVAVVSLLVLACFLPGLFFFLREETRSNYLW